MVADGLSEAWLRGTPYLLDEAGSSELVKRVDELERRVMALRESGTLSDEALREYFGEKKFELIAESNALEGSTLDAGETELAVLRGVTLTGHDPAYVEDAKHLHDAIERIGQLARDRTGSVTLDELKNLHALVLRGRRGAGVFRSEPVRIAKSGHIPPRTWNEVMEGMEAWEDWSVNHPTLPRVVRAAVLHAWLVHIHPFLDGNGRTARAVTTLELVRAGLPAIVIKKHKDRDRYLDGLGASDGGDIGPFLDLVLEKTDATLVGFERLVLRADDRTVDRYTEIVRGRTRTWNEAVDLLVTLIGRALERRLSSMTGVKYTIRRYGSGLDANEFVQLCERNPSANTWVARFEFELPGTKAASFLVWTGYRSAPLESDLAGGPSLFWSTPNTVASYPPWVQAERGPGSDELTLDVDRPDRWIRRAGRDQGVESPTETAEIVASAMVEAVLQPGAT